MIPQSALEDFLQGADVVTAGEGCPLALAHGAGGAVNANFGVLMSELNHDRRMVGVNYPGSGMTPSTRGPLNLDDLADALVAAMLRDGHEQFPIVGVSLGCAVAITAAARHPEHVSGLVLSVGFARSDENLRQAVEVYQAFIDQEQWLPLARFLLLVCSSPATLGAFDSADAQAVSDGIDPGFAVASAPQLQLAAAVDVREAAASLNIPTQVYVSGQDRLVLPASTETLGELIPGAKTVTYPDAGHIYTSDEERIWASDVSSFLAARDL